MAKLNVRNRNKGKFDKDGNPKKPNWEWRFEGAKIDGKRNQITKAGFRTQKEALEAGTKALAEYNNAGLHFEPTEISVSDYLDYWFDTHVKVNLKYNTQLAYRNIIEKHLKARFGSYKLKAVNASIVQQYANDLKINGYSKSMLVGILTTFSSAMDYAVEPLQYIPNNPIRLVKFPKVEKQPRQRIILQMDDWHKIQSRFANTRFYVMLMIGFHTGLRIGEVAGLTWDDVDFENKEIKVDKITIKRNPEGDKKSSWYFSDPKTDTSSRTVKFGATLYNFLKEEKIRQQKNELKYGEYYTVHVLKQEKDEKGNTIYRIVPIQKHIKTQLPRTNLICVDVNGEFTSTDSFKYCSRIINREMKILFDFHSLRHTHATMLIESGAHVKAVQERLGHKKIETTLQTYVHNTESLEAGAVDAFENAIKKVSTNE
ncbi:tyrosine-type recombinase/integrase [Listeria monocytogenes]